MCTRLFSQMQDSLPHSLSRVPSTPEANAFACYSRVNWGPDALTFIQWMREQPFFSSTLFSASKRNDDSTARYIELQLPGQLDTNTWPSPLYWWRKREKEVKLRNQLSVSCVHHHVHLFLRLVVSLTLSLLPENIILCAHSVSGVIISLSLFTLCVLCVFTFATQRPMLLCMCEKQSKLHPSDQVNYTGYVWILVPYGL